MKTPRKTPHTMAMLADMPGAMPSGVGAPVGMPPGPCWHLPVVLTLAYALLLSLLPLISYAASPAPPATTQAALKPKIAVLPFIGASAAEQKLAERMRFALAQKLSNDASGGGQFDRLDSVTVDNTISALQIPYATSSAKLPDDDDLQKILETLGTDQAFLGTVKGRALSVSLYQGAKLAKTVTVEVPSDQDSPKLTVENLITQLIGAKFTHIRELECDHSHPAVEKRFAQRPNLVLDPGFEDAPKNALKAATHWGAILGSDRYPPPVLTADEAEALPPDRVAIVPKSVAGDGAAKDGHCLMLRMSKNTAENNGLACESIWIPVEHNQTYRFTCQYHSTGPVPRLFLKGFALKPDQFGDKSDPESVRREFYRAQILPRKKNANFEPIEMDFTPSVVQEGKGDGGSKTQGMKIQWLRVDLYIYLTPGTVFFDDIVVKKISE